jgi:class 3 adenylate cyclase
MVQFRYNGHENEHLPRFRDNDVCTSGHLCPRDLFKRSRGAFRSSIRREIKMPSLNRFFPLALLDRLNRRETWDVVQLFTGTCLFADVSGFTAMSEALLAMGKEGSEVLTKVLNRFYSRVVETVLMRDGDVMRFAGDAVTVWFEDQGRAVRTALELQAFMPEFKEIHTPAGLFSLKMKIGLASGTASFFIVGDDLERDYVLAGTPVDQSAEAEHHARAGEVVLYRDGRSDTISEWPESGEPVPEKPEPGKLSEPDFKGFLHPLLWEAISSGQEIFINEHRHITILFAAFKSLQGEGQDAPETVGEFYLKASKAVRDMDGYINKVDMGDKGSKLLILFGAPRAHEDDEIRALLCAQSLIAAARETGFSLRMGLNSGRAFCGIVGSLQRCEYTVMGDAVNVAARLMQAAPEMDFLVSHSVKSRASHLFQFRDLPPLILKGKNEPFPVACLEGRKGETLDLPFFIGRKREEAALQQAVANQPSGQAGLFWIHGEAGIGKTAFVQYFLQNHAVGHRVIFSRCHSHAASIPYAVFQSLISELLHVPGEGEGPAPAQAAEMIVRKRDPEVAEYLPILVNAFRLAEKAGHEPAMEPEVRRSLLWKMTGLLLQDSLDRQPVYWVLDGVQWLDEESRNLLFHLARIMETSSLTIAVTHREGPPKEEGIYLGVIPIPPLSKEETQSFISKSLSVREVPPEAVRKVQGACRGNPLLIQESLKLLFQSGYLARDEEHPQIVLVDESRPLDLPDTVAGLVLSQLDALPLAEKTTLRTLSVAGETIPKPLAARLGLDQASLQTLVEKNQFLGQSADQSAYVFLQSHVASAIYDSLEFEQKRELHLKVGRILESLSDPGEPPPHRALAHHYGRAGAAEAVPHLLEVAREAQASYALQEAIRLYENLLSIAPGMEASVQKAVLELSRLYLLTGRAADAGKLIDRRLPGFDSETLSQAYRILAESYSSQGQFPQAEQALMKAVEKASGNYEQFLASSALGKLYGKTGRMQKAQEVLVKIQKEFDAFSEDKEFKMNQMRLSFVTFQTSDQKDTLETFKKIKRWFERRGLIEGSYLLAGNLGAILGEGGRYAQALAAYRRSLHICKKYGIWESEININLMLNMGLQYDAMGRWNPAEQLFLSAQSYARRFNSPLIYRAHCLLGENHLHRGRLQSSILDLRKSLADCESFGLPRNETLEILLDFDLMVFDKQSYLDHLGAYEQEIDTYKMSYLKPTLINYKGEAMLEFGHPALPYEDLKENLRTCIEEGLLPEAYRASRILHRAGGEASYLHSMEKVLSTLKKKRFQIEFMLLKYQNQPAEDAKRLLIRQISRCPYADLNWKAYLAFAERDKDAKQRRRHLHLAAQAADSMLADLEEPLAACFKGQPLYQRLMQMSVELK